MWKRTMISVSSAPNFYDIEYYRMERDGSYIEEEHYIAKEVSISYTKSIDCLQKRQT
jgi:hypothetical protein